MIFTKVKNIPPTNEHAIWYELNDYVVYADLNEGQLAIKVADDINTKLRLSTQSGDILLDIEDGNMIKVLPKFIKDDMELNELFEGIHPDLKLNIENKPRWQLDFIDSEGCIFLGKLKSPYLSEALKEIESIGKKDILDLIDTLKRIG